MVPRTRFGGRKKLNKRGKILHLLAAITAVFVLWCAKINISNDKSGFLNIMVG